MSKRVYISADYADGDGDRNVVEELNKWGQDKLHKVDFVDMAKVVSGSVSSTPDCRICDLKAEFNRQINASSAVVFVVGDKTACRKAGSSCYRCSRDQWACSCTPYKDNRMVARCVKLLSRQISLIMKMWGVLIHILICDMSLNKLRRKTRRSSFFIIPPETRKVGFRST